MTTSVPPKTLNAIGEAMMNRRVRPWYIWQPEIVTIRVFMPNPRNLLHHIYIPDGPFNNKHAAVMYHNYNSRGVLKFNKTRYYPK